VPFPVGPSEFLGALFSLLPWPAAAGGRAVAASRPSLPPAVRDGVVSVSMLQAAGTDSSSALAGVNPWLCGSTPYCECLDGFFSFILQMGQISRKFFSAVPCLHEKNQLLGVLEARAGLWIWLYCLAGQTLTFATLRTDVLKGSSYRILSEKTGSGGQRELYLTGLGRLAMWVLSQGQGFVYGSMKNSPLSVTWVAGPPGAACQWGRVCAGAGPQGVKQLQRRSLLCAGWGERAPPALGVTCLAIALMPGEASGWKFASCVFSQGSLLSVQFNCEDVLRKASGRQENAALGVCNHPCSLHL